MRRDVGLRRGLSLLGLAAVLVCGACGAGDERLRVLEERTRWKVELLDWVAHDDGGLTMTSRVSGPVHSKLPWLTVRLDLLDASGRPIQSLWHSFDLSQVDRGGPREFTSRLAVETAEVEQLALSLVPRPTDEEAAQLRELNP